MADRSELNFEDLLNIEEEEMRRLVLEIPLDTITFAFKTAPETFKEKLYRVIGEAHSHLIREGMAKFNPSNNDIARARREILNKLKELRFREGFGGTSLS